MPDIRSFFSKPEALLSNVIVVEPSIITETKTCSLCSEQVKDWRVVDGSVMCTKCKVVDPGEEKVAQVKTTPPANLELLEDEPSNEPSMHPVVLQVKKRDKIAVSTPKPKRPKKNKACADTLPKLTAEHFHPKDPRLAKLSQADVKMVSKRRLRDKQEDVPYDIELVPPALGCSIKSLVTDSDIDTSSMLKESVLLRCEGPDSWTCTEMLQLCSEASWRRVLLDRERNSSHEVSADAKPLTLEYICDRLDTDDPIYGYQVRHASTGWLQGFITYTIFTTWSPYFRFDSRSPCCGITADDYQYRAVDKTGEVAEALQREKRWGDPAEEGIVFDKVAEVSLLGGLGCGAWLLSLAMEEMRSNGFRWVVLQATDQAIPFYENMGFVRVGCVARHPSQEKEESVETSSKKTSKMKTPLSEGAPIVPPDCPPEDRYYWLAMWMIHLVTTWKLLDIEGIFSVPVDLEQIPNYKDIIPHDPVDLSLMQRRAVDFRYPNLAALVRDLHKMVDNAIAFNGKASPIALLAKSLRTKALAGVRKLMVEEKEVSKASRDMSEVVWPPECWLFQAPPKSFTKNTVPSPVPSSLTRESNNEVNTISESTSEDSTHVKEHEVLLDEDVTPLNPHQIEDESHHAWLQTEEGISFTQRMAAAADKDTNVLGYVHWTFPDQAIEDQYPSYMMARPLTSQLPNKCPVSMDKISPEMAAGMPRGVTPRGNGFVAKFTSPSSCDYLGSFPSAREAKAAYQDAHNAYQATAMIHETVTKSAKPAPSCDNLLQHIDQWLVSEPPLIASRRMAHPSHEREDSIDKNQSFTPQVESSADSIMDTSRTSEVSHTKKAKKPVKAKLYNRLVLVKDQPPCYPHKYWFVYQYVPDMEWCHLCPVEQAGVFKTGKRQGRPRYKLVPEGR